MSEQPLLAQETPDPVLVERLRAGDHKAAHELYRRYARFVHNLVVRTFGPDHEVPDIVNEVFARVIEQAHTLTDSSAFKSWLGSVTLFTARALLRSRRMRRKHVGVVAPSELPDVPVPPNPLEARRAVRRTQSAIACLTAEERTAYLLRFVDGMELTKVAAAMGVSVGTVKRRLASARQALARAAVSDPYLSEYARTPAQGPR